MAEEDDMALFTKHTPPDLEALLGYHGARKWVAFFWGRKIGGNSLCHGFDGKEFNPVNLTAWEAFFNHPLIAAMNHIGENGHSRKRFEFGNDTMPSACWLLMDRGRRELYAASKEKALNYLRMKNELLDGSATVARPTSVDRLDNDTRQTIDEMLRWLDIRS